MSDSRTLSIPKVYKIHLHHYLAYTSALLQHKDCQLQPKISFQTHLHTSKSLNKFRHMKTRKLQITFIVERKTILYCPLHFEFNYIHWIHSLIQQKFIHNNPRKKRSKVKRNIICDTKYIHTSKCFEVCNKFYIFKLMWSFWFLITSKKESVLKTYLQISKHP